LFETYVVSAVAVILLGSALFPGYTNAIIYPLMIGAASIVTTIVGTWLSAWAKVKYYGAMYKGFAVTGILSAIVFLPSPKKLWAITECIPLPIFFTARL